MCVCVCGREEESCVVCVCVCVCVCQTWLSWWYHSCEALVFSGTHHLFYTSSTQPYTAIHSYTQLYSYTAITIQL